MAPSVTYKVVELSTVTDDQLEETLNHWTGRGYVLDAIHFAMRETQRRPSMAFVIFVRQAPAEVAAPLGE